jgi:hypothetical protein
MPLRGGTTDRCRMILDGPLLPIKAARIKGPCYLTSTQSDLLGPRAGFGGSLAMASRAAARARSSASASATAAAAAAVRRGSSSCRFDLHLRLAYKTLLFQGVSSPTRHLGPLTHTHTLILSLRHASAIRTFQGTPELRCTSTASRLLYIYITLFQLIVWLARKFMPRSIMQPS